MDRGIIQAAVTETAAAVLVVEEATRKLAAAGGVIQRYDSGRPYRVKENGEIEIVERLMAAPVLRRGEVAFYEALSFARFVKRFLNTSTVIFADSIGAKFTAALDYHAGSSQRTDASWDQFRAVLPLRPTPDWTAWVQANKTPMSQADFAQFLEDRLPNIAAPAGAKLVEIARTLEANTDVQFESHIRAEDGSHRFRYMENVNATAAGAVVIPAEFTLVLQPFEGSKQYEVVARLRYRITSKQLTLWFHLVRVEDVLKEAFNDELLKIAGEVGEHTPIYNGPAPAAQVPPKAVANTNGTGDC